MGSEYAHSMGVRRVWWGWMLMLIIAAGLPFALPFHQAATMVFLSLRPCGAFCSVARRACPRQAHTDAQTCRRVCRWLTLFFVIDMLGMLTRVSNVGALHKFGSFGKVWGG